MDVGKIEGHILLWAMFAVASAVVSKDQINIVSNRVSCHNEGELIAIDNIDKNQCFTCTCKNGYVECSSDCPKIDECHMVVEDACCKLCQGCWHRGSYRQSHTEWLSSSDPCTIYRCEAGVVTVSDLHCYTPCANPLPPEPGKCCPTCPECAINGQIASDDRDVISDDPCLKCRCSGGRMICSKQACPVLQCQPSRQVHLPGECCPKCFGTRALLTINNTCTLQTSFFREGDNFNIDKCTNCTCTNGTSVCRRASCPILDCAPDMQQPVPGSCCKKCILPQESRSTCSIKGKMYQDGQEWRLDSCKSCKCHRGMPSCAITRCNTTCAAGTRMEKIHGECCPKCVEMEGVCMAFGDPHYKTYDGQFYSFKGIGKYQLTADCTNNTFSVKVANYNRGSSSSTKRVAVRYLDIRLNLQQKGRIKYNGKRISLPYKVDGKFKGEKVKDSIEVTLNNGVKIYWNGRTFVEVAVPAFFKNKLCGLCGNFNNNVQDDFKTKIGRTVTDKDAMVFGASWCVGKRSECEKKIRSSREHYHPKRQNPCKLLKSDTFSPCHTKLNYNKYSRACSQDMASCPNQKCYCESLLAYSRECERLRVHLPNWSKHSFCDPGSLKRPKMEYVKKKTTSHHHHRKSGVSKKEDLLKQLVNRTRTNLHHPPPKIPLT